MISSKLAKQIDNIFDHPTIPTREAVVNLVSELEEECTFLHEKVERLEYDLGLTGIEGVKDDNAG